VWVGLWASIKRSIISLGRRWYPERGVWMGNVTLKVKGSRSGAVSTIVGVAPV
jgi:hypothetical protein